MDNSKIIGDNYYKLQILKEGKEKAQQEKLNLNKEKEEKFFERDEIKQYNNKLIEDEITYHKSSKLLKNLKFKISSIYILNYIISLIILLLLTSQIIPAVLFGVVISGIVGTYFSIEDLKDYKNIKDVKKNKTIGILEDEICFNDIKIDAITKKIELISKKIDICNIEIDNIDQMIQTIINEIKSNDKIINELASNIIKNMNVDNTVNLILEEEKPKTKKLTK